MEIYPEIAVVSVTSHGTIKINPENDEPYTFQMPNEMSMTLLNSVAPGVCNFLQSYDADDFSNKLLKKLKDQEDVQLLQNNPVAFVNSLVDILKIYDIEMKKELYSNMKIKDEEQDPDEEQFIFHDDKSYNIHSYKAGDNIINKEYSRNNRSEQNDGIWNFKINILNKIGFPDIIREIRGRSGRDDYSYITLQDIVNYLERNEVKHVIFLDLSCSSFVTAPPPNIVLGDIDDDFEEEIIENPRKIRSIRRDILRKDKLGGKRKRTQKRKRSRKRTQKRKRYRKRTSRRF